MLTTVSTFHPLALQPGPPNCYPVAMFPFDNASPLRVAAALLLLAVPACSQTSAPTQTQNPAPPVDTRSRTGASTPTGETKPATGAHESASGKESTQSPFTPAPPPTKPFARPRIGLALGGGGALGLSEIGTLQWLEEHHIPVDVIAGTSMGCMISALYSTGRTPDQLTAVMNDKTFASVFSFSNAYQARSFRRREDSRELPNALTVGVRHGISFRNAVLVDQGLNAFLDRQFLRYDDQTAFNDLPIPLRCLSTDLNTARTVTFTRGSLPDAVRASVSLPGVFQPFELDGHTYVDGGVLENLPTATVHQMQADVVLAVSLPLEPTAPGDLSSLLGVLGRSFSVAIEGAEREQRKLADVVIMPDLKGFTAVDYLKAVDLSKRGYAAAEAQKATLLKYAVSDSDWAAYLAHRQSLVRGPAGPVLRVRVTAPSASATLAAQRLFAPLVNQPVDTRKIEAILDQLRADGRYEADYTVGYESQDQFNNGAATRKAGTVDVKVATKASEVPTAPIPTVKDPNEGKPGAANPKIATDTSGVASSSDPNVIASLADDPNAPGLARTRNLSDASLQDIGNRPIILVSIADKKTGPPFVLLGANVQAQAPGITKATIEATLLDQDLGGYGNELRSHFVLGYLTDLNTEYFHPIGPLSTGNRTLFVAPRARLLRQPFPIFVNQNRVAERQYQYLGTGADLGLTNLRTQELRAGYDFAHIRWNTLIGREIEPDQQVNVDGQYQRARLQYTFDTQDRALLPTFGVHLTTEFAYLFATVASPSTPQFTTAVTFAHQFGHPPDSAHPNTGKTVFVLDAEGGTMFRSNVAQPFRYTLGGPIRLGASALDQYRGTEYLFFAPALLRRIAQLPRPLGQSIYLGGALEAGLITAVNQPLINREDIFFGLVAETPLGVITAGPALGTNGERKFVFTLGKLF